jgi:hypothetical protein
MFEKYKARKIVLELHKRNSISNCERDVLREAVKQYFLGNKSEEGLIKWFADNLKPAIECYLEECDGLLCSGSQIFQQNYLVGMTKFSRDNEFRERTMRHLDYITALAEGNGFSKPFHKVRFKYLLTLY